jgi:hypothetical protein
MPTNSNRGEARNKGHHQHISKKRPRSAGVPANAVYFLQCEAFAVPQLAAAFENGSMCLFFQGSPKSGSEQPHISEGALRAQTVWGISRDGDVPGS